MITTAGGSGAAKQVIRYLTERVVGNGSFGVVFQAKCIETGETVRACPPACLRWRAVVWSCGGAERQPASQRQSMEQARQAWSSSGGSRHAAAAVAANGHSV